MELFLKFKPVSLSKHQKRNLFITCSMQLQYLRSRFQITLFDVVQICDVLSRKKQMHCCLILPLYLLNSRQFSFINQVVTVVKSYKEQIKLTLFHDCTPS